tara:strand:+ start:32437 stop:32775 length:339 start_codon:yes stop_codon:yes gene_type:complete
MLQKVNLIKILFLDIETVPEEENFDQFSKYKKELWTQKTADHRGTEDSPEDFYECGGILAEFFKIICISVCYFVIQKEGFNFRIKTFFGDEKELLVEFIWKKTLGISTHRHH